MHKKFYKLPIDFSSFILSRNFTAPMCSERESIDQNIDLLLSTCPGEHQFNKAWGCQIWEMDFVNVSFRKKWEDQFMKYIKDAIEKFEARLSDLKIDIHIAEVSEEDDVSNTTAIKKRVTVYVNAKLVSNGEDCGFRYLIYLGPLSTE